MSRRLLKSNPSQVYAVEHRHTFSTLISESQIFPCHLEQTSEITFALLFYCLFIITTSQRKVNRRISLRPKEEIYGIVCPSFQFCSVVLFLLIVNFNMSQKTHEKCRYNVTPSGQCDSSSENLLRFHEKLLKQNHIVQGFFVFLDRGLMIMITMIMVS